MKNYIFSICTIINIAFYNESFASHVMGGEFQYECLDSINLVYRIKLSLYRDCSGIATGNSPWTANFSNGCSNMTLTPTFLGKKDITPLYGTKPSTTCSNPGSSIKGTEVWEYEWVGSFPKNCGIVRVCWDQCCRSVGPYSGSIFDETGPIGGHLETHINTALQRGNNSPVFANSAIPFICLNTKFKYSAYCNEKDGDSLVYSMFAPYGDPTGGQCIYKQPYSYIKPFDMVESSISFNPITGDFSFTPTKLQTSNMAFKVEEYRRLKGYNGLDSFVYAGMTMRDLQVSIVVACNPIQMTGIITKSIYGASYSDSNSLRACSDSLYFESKVILENLLIESIPFYFIKSPNAFAPKANCSYILKRDTLNHRDTITAKYAVSKNNMTYSDYNLELHGGYGIQGFKIENIISISIKAGPKNLLKDINTLTYCPGGIPAKISLSPYYLYDFEPKDSVNIDYKSNSLVFSPSQTTKYTITQFSSSPTCSIVKDVTVISSKLPLSSISPKLIDNVFNKPLSISLNLDSQFAPYQFDWTPKKWLYDANNIERYDIQNPISTARDTIIYLVNISDKNGCRFSHKAQINVIKTKLRFHFFIDLNKNNFKDIDEENYSLGLLTIKDKTESFKISPNQLGVIEFINGLYGNIYLNYELKLKGFKAILPDSIVNLMDGKIKEYEIPIQPNGFYNNLSLSIISKSIPRQGVNVVYQIICTNKGNRTENNINISLTKNIAQKYIFSNQVCDTNGGYYSWQIDSIKPFKSKIIDLILLNGTPPLLNLNDLLTHHAEVHSEMGDDDTSDNKVIKIEKIIGSFDPNLISESHGNSLSIDQGIKGVDLYYLIQFQNTGNDTAFNINIRDTIGNLLEMNSFEMLYASHPYILTIKNQNQLRWDFANILLPDSNHSEKNSHGYIYYKIKTIPDLSVYHRIRNTAAIYFDYNAPVITNTNVISIIENVKDSTYTQDSTFHGPSQLIGSYSALINVFPNPTNRELIINGILTPIAYISIYNALNELVLERKMKSNDSLNAIRIDVNEIPIGNYLLQIKTDKDIIVKKIVKE